MPNHHDLSQLIWQIADLLRGPYRPPQYERVMLPMTVLRRFDAVLAPSKDKVLAEFEKRKGGKLNDDALDQLLNKAAGQRFHNHSPLTFEKLKGDPDNIEKHLVSYIKGFSANVRKIFDFFEFENEIEKMREANILFLVVRKFAEMDLHPIAVPNDQMGLVFENLIRRFNELANETAGDHFTPREVIRLMVNILFINDDDLLATPGTVRKLLDPACGTGGMLAEAQNYLRDHHRAAKLYVFGQDYNKRAYATAAADMLMKQVDQNGGSENVRYGDVFIEDRFDEPPYDKFDYLLANPPFGVDWKKQAKEIQQEHDQRGFDGRFGAGLPRVNDGALLFLQHMVSKFEPVLPAQQKHGSRLAIVFSGSPLLLHHFLNPADIKWLAQFADVDLSDAQRRGLVFLREAGALDNAAYRQLNGADTLTASQELRKLRQAKLIEKKGQGSATYYVPGIRLQKALVDWQPGGAGTGVQTGKVHHLTGVQMGKVRDLPEALFARLPNCRDDAWHTGLHAA